MPAAITLENLTLGYDRHPAVHHVSGTVPTGSRLAVVGPNGAGKSTLLKGIAGLLRPIGGSIVMTPETRRCLAYLPQAAEVDRDFPITVHDFVAMGALRRVGFFRPFGRAIRIEIEHALDAVGLGGFEARILSTLSGGQLQRVLFARLLMQDAPVILLDEPFSAIDEQTVQDLLGLVSRWTEEGRTVVAVLHDMPLVRRHFPSALLLAREMVGWGPTEAVLSADNTIVARRMVEAIDRSAHICEQVA
ncbi:MAG: ABC transporter ATP-binding protein [Proteobacteria bacterium]|nr:ABC transporter ATP-binding protein [Pseudomonadota bacterium]